MLDDLGLVGAIKSFSVHGSQIRFDVHAPEPLPPVPAAVEVAVYRIVREAIHNVEKHARATACVIQIEPAAGQLHVRVTDNGTGGPHTYTGGVGVRSMQERAVEVGGSLAIEPAMGGGTRVVAQFALDV